MLINNQLIITTMKTLFEVTQSMVAMAEHGTFHLDDEIEVSALILCVVAIILVFSVSAIRWILSLTIKTLKK